MKILSPLLSVSLCLSFLPPSLFASDARQRQHELMREQIQPDRLTATEETLLFEDDEFGEQLILRRIPPPPPFTLFADVAASYTSNPLLLPDGSNSDYFYSAAAGIAYQPPAVREWEPALGIEFFAQYQLFRYDRLTPLDFNGQTIGITATYSLPYETQAYGGWIGNRLEDRENGDRFYRESQLTLGVSKIFREVREAATFFGAQADLRNTSPGSLSRLEYGPYIGVHLQLAERLPFRIRYRFAHQHYLQDGRDDLNSWVTTSLAWNFHPGSSLRLQANFAANRSNRDQHEYDLITGLVGAQLSHSF